MKWNYWTLLVIGLWLVISPWILGFSSFNLPAWNSILMGVLVIIFSIWSFSGPQQ
ncbi:MAG: SPW repeat protein [Minisyncoccia bacterium]